MTAQEAAKFAPVDPRLWWGYDVVQWYDMWKSLDYNFLQVFGMPFVELPRTLREDLINLRHWERWYEYNAALVSAENLPRVDEL
jgi:hypothetical protein